MKVDIYGCERRYARWKEASLAVGIKNITRENSEVIVEHVIDMEKGRNTSGAMKGGRSYARLCNIAQRMSQITRMLQERGVSDLRVTSEDQISNLFSDIRRGHIKTARGTVYKSTGDYVKVFKNFWHWWQKVNRKKGIRVRDITEDLSTASAKPKFVYLKKDQVEKLLEYFDQDTQVTLLFMFDSIIRAPTELLSLRVADIEVRDDEVWIHISDEISKTSGRSFNLLYCGDELLSYIKRKKLKPEDAIFDFSPAYLNRRLKEAAKQEFGDGLSHPSGDYYANLSLYDFRHSAAIHFRLLAKDNPHLVSLDAVRHRAGWKDFDMLNYYTQFIGMDGKIEKHGLLIQQDKNIYDETNNQANGANQEILRLRRELDDIKQFIQEFRQGAILAKSALQAKSAHLI